VYLVIGEKKLELTKDEWKKEHYPEDIPDDFPIDEDWKKVNEEGIEEDSFVWDWGDFNDASGLNESDKVRIIIKDRDSEVFDASGWYFRVSGSLLGRTSTGSAVINRGKLKRPGKSR